MFADYHVHTPYCGHAQGKTIEYIESAIKLGFSQIGFSDHLGRYYLSKVQRKRYWDWGMPERDVARYFSELLDLKEAYGDGIAIRIGLEIDYIEGAESILEEIIARYPFDFLLGSIHCLPSIGWRHLSQYAKVDAARVYEAYFTAIESAISSGIFQSIAHIDFLWRYVPWENIPKEQMVNYLSRITRLSAKHKTNLEINANGYLWSKINDDQPYDIFDMFLSQIKEDGATITIGSDAHTPELVGKAFPQIINSLKKKGIHTFSTFDQKKQTETILG